MVKSTDLSFFDHCIANGYPSAELNHQYRTIPIMSTIISDIFYKGNVICMVDPKKRPNSGKASAVLKAKYQLSQPIAFIDVASKAIRVGATRSKQNYLEAQMGLDMADALMASGIGMNEICILSGHVAQVNLLHKIQSSRETPTNNHVECLIIDKSQGQQYSCVIWTVSDTTVGFHNQPSRSLVATSRAKDCLVILPTGLNWKKMGVGICKPCRI